MLGSINKTGPGRWKLVFDLPRGTDGKRRQVLRRIKGTKAEAEEKFHELLTEYKNGGFVEPSRLTISSFLEKWLDTIEPSVSGKTYERYDQLIKNHITPQLGDIVLQKLHPMNVQEFYNKLLGEGRIDGKGGLSPRTVKHTHRVFKKALTQAVTWKLTASNPAEGAVLPKVENKEIEFLDRDELATLLDAIEGRSLYPIILLAATTGMRRGELLGQHWSDVDLDEGWLRVTQTLEQTTKHGLQLKEPKSKAGRRKISLPQTTVAMLRQHQLDQSELRLKLGLGGKNDGLVLPVLDANKGFTFRSPRALTKEFDRLVRNLDITRITFHGLRHTHITHLLMDNVPIKLVSQRAGHASVSITLDVYGHVLPDMQQGVADLIDQQLGKGKSKQQEN